MYVCVRKNGESQFIAELHRCGSCYSTAKLPRWLLSSPANDNVSWCYQIYCYIVTKSRQPRTPAKPIAAPYLPINVAKCDANCFSNYLVINVSDTFPLRPFPTITTLNFQSHSFLPPWFHSCTFCYSAFQKHGDRGKIAVTKLLARFWWNFVYETVIKTWLENFNMCTIVTSIGRNIVYLLLYIKYRYRSPIWESF